MLPYSFKGTPQMGTLLQNGAAEKLGSVAIHTFYSNKSWIEGAATDQLLQISKLSGVKEIVAFPDLHPGKYGPVGCAILSENVYPHLIGNDIGCGMSLFALDLPKRKLRLDKAAVKLRTLEQPWEGDRSAICHQANIQSYPDHTTLGSIGGGNHFCEIQTVSEIFDADHLKQHDLTNETLLLLVHSGSRSLGAEIFGRLQSCLMNPFGEEFDQKDYLTAHNEAIIWAKLNREIIAQRASEALRTSCRLIADSPHNLIEETSRGYLHRKGAAKADIPLVPLAGSRDALSYLLRPTVAQDKALSSLAHGAGRKYDRQSMKGRIKNLKSTREALQRTSFGGHVICEDKQLLIEEAPSAYKDPAQVLNDLISNDLAKPIAALKPLLTYKKANTKPWAASSSKIRHLKHRGEQR